MAKTERRIIRTVQDVDELLYSLDYPDSHILVGNEIRKMGKALRATQPVDKSTLDKLTEMFFRSGRGNYVGIENQLPSGFIDVYPSWLKIHEKYLNNVVNSKRILIVGSQAQLFNDKMKNPTNFFKFVEWHQENKVGLYYITDKTVNRIKRDFNLESPVVALWEEKYVVVFKHGKDGVRLRAITKRDKKQFSIFEKYVKRVEEAAKEVKPEELMLIAPPLARNWTGYTGSPEERTPVFSFIEHQLSKYRNHGTILDVATGIGNEAIHLLKNDFKVELNEVDPTFLRLLQENVENDQLLKLKGIRFEQLRVHQKDWSRLSDSVQPASMNAIVAIGNDLCMVTNDDGGEQRRRCITEFYAALSPGGTLIIDERNFSKISEKLQQGESVFGTCILYPGKKVECKIKPTDHKNKLKFDFHLGNKPIGNIIVECLGRGELKHLLEAAGFNPIVTFSDLRSTELPDPNADVYTYIATKPDFLAHAVAIGAQLPMPPPEEVSVSTTYIGSEKETGQWGVIGKTDDSLATFDLNAPKIVFVCGRQGSGKGYTIGVICEMLIGKSIQRLSNIQKNATIIVLHKPKNENIVSEFWSMTKPNDVKEEIEKLWKEYEAKPQSSISEKDVRIFIDPEVRSRAGEFQKEYGTQNIYPLLIDPTNLAAGDWQIVLSDGYVEQPYVKTIVSIIEEQQKSEATFDPDDIEARLKKSALSKKQKDIAKKRIGLVKEHLAKGEDFLAKIAKGGVNILDFRRSMHHPADLFSIMTLLVSVLQTRPGMEDEIFVFVLNEAHEYFKNGMSNKFVDSLVNLIRYKRHGNNWLLLDTHFPEDVDDKVISLADVKIVHCLDKTVNRDILDKITEKPPKSFADLKTGEAVIVACDSSRGRNESFLVKIRPRLTKHGGAAKVAVQNTNVPT